MNQSPLLAAQSERLDDRDEGGRRPAPLVAPRTSVNPPALSQSGQAVRASGGGHWPLAVAVAPAHIRMIGKERVWRQR